MEGRITRRANEAKTSARMSRALKELRKEKGCPEHAEQPKQDYSVLIPLDLYFSLLSMMQYLRTFQPLETDLYKNGLPAPDRHAQAQGQKHSRTFVDPDITHSPLDSLPGLKEDTKNHSKNWNTQDNSPLVQQKTNNRNEDTSPLEDTCNAGKN